MLLQEWTLDGSFIRFALIAICPLLYCVSLVRLFSSFPAFFLHLFQFFTLQLTQNVSMAYVFLFPLQTLLLHP
jgi:hypothetical protein